MSALANPSRIRIPYQCLIRSGKILIAARGSIIDLFSLETHSFFSSWIPVSWNLEQSSVGTTHAQTSHPPKRIKLSNAGDDSRKRGDHNKENKRSNAVASGLRAPAIIALAGTKKAGHVIAVTAEDKSIRVFRIVSDPDGKYRLQQISKRIMPKRPCAIVVTDDDSTIIAADKFGDVYSLPLLLPESGNQDIAKSDTQGSNTSISKPFVPAANDLTVHSQRNLKALENQKRQTNKPLEKLEPTFEHKTLLGHVSMLTDIALVTLQGRQHIITADRDEHIRISRGIPQAHIIEGFCLGHTEFVSRLCVPEGRSNVLISGGGDDDILVWNWPFEQLMSKTNITSHVTAVMRKLGRKTGNGEAADLVRVAIAGICHTTTAGEDGTQDLIIVNCEGVPALFTFLLTSLHFLEYIQTVELPGNALSVLAPSATKDGSLIVSIDGVHQCGSRTERRDCPNTTSHLWSYVFQNHHVAPMSAFEVVDDHEELDGSKVLDGLTNMLYNLENLRKRDGEGAEDI